MKWNILCVILLSLIIVGCGKSNNDDNKSSTEKTINGVKVSKGWCQVESLTDGLDVVTRINFLDDNKISMDRILLANNKSPVAYRFSKDFGYVTDDAYVGYDVYGLKSVRGAAEVQSSQDFIKQERIFNEILSKNANLEKNITSFFPDRAVILKSKSFLSPDALQYFYPCDNYSSTFNKDLTVRPMIEFQILLGQAIKRSEDILSITMALRSPIDEIVTDYKKLKGTQWCKWHEIRTVPEAPNLNILTVNDGTFRQNSYSGILQVFYQENPSRVDLRIEEISAKEARIYSIDKSAAGLKGQTEQPFKDEVTYKMVKDANGVFALIKEVGESTLVLGFEIFYACDDQRPLATYPAYTELFNKILKAEISQ